MEVRRYEGSHPWLTFRADLTGAPPELWSLLGEACSKCEHIAGVPLPPRVANELHTLYLAKGIHATTAIEGNTLSEEQVREHLEGKLSVPASQKYLEDEIDNIETACEVILTGIAEHGPAKLSGALIRSFNKMILDGLPTDPDVVPGELRDHDVSVARYRGAPPEDCEFLLERLCEWLERMEPREDLGPGVEILKAILAHLYIAWIHPFGDGNGRTARLLEFTILVGAGFPSPTAHLLSNHYNATRAEYYRQLDQASRNGGNPVPFILYALRGLVDELRAQIEVIRQTQWDLAWRDYVDEKFRSLRGTVTNFRRKLMVLALSKAPEPVPRGEIRYLSIELAEAYAGKTPKTVSRDLNKLMEMDLIARTPTGYISRRGQILAFLPLRAGGLE